MTNHNPTRRSQGAIWIPIVLAVIIFIGDIHSPRGVVLCTAYIPLIYFGLGFARTETVFAYAGIASVLTVAGAFLKHHSPVTIPMLLTNRIVNVAVIWWTAELLRQFRAAKDQLTDGELYVARREAAGKSALLATIVSSSGDAIIGKSIQGIINSWNPGADRLFGYTAEEAIGKPITILIPPDLISEEDMILSELIMGKAIENYETTRMRKDGRRVRVAITVSPVRDPDGRVIGASKSVREIGGQKNAEAMLAAVVDNAFDGLITLDDKGKVETFNRACQTIFGYTQAEVVGRDIKILVPSTVTTRDIGDLIFDETTGLFRANSESVIELTGRRKDGSLFPMEISVRSFQFSGTTHFSGILRDITSRKQAEAEAASFTEALIRSNQALDEFAYAASHDLKAPLRVIDNTSKWLEEDLADQLTAEMRDNMQLLRGRVRRMDKLLNDLLAYSRIGRKPDDMEIEIVSGRALMDDVLAILSPPEGFEIAVSPAFSSIQVGRMPLQQVLMNLIGNAIKHHGNPRGKIEVTVQPGEAMNTFSVKDDGPGIDPRFHARIFDMFQTLKPRDQVEGSGMGLAMVRKYVELMGGKITVDSAEGKGSIFRFTWPAQSLGAKHKEAA